MQQQFAIYRWILYKMLDLSLHEYCHTRGQKSSWVWWNNWDIVLNYWVQQNMHKYYELSFISLHILCDSGQPMYQHFYVKFNSIARHELPLCLLQILDSRQPLQELLHIFQANRCRLFSLSQCCVWHDTDQCNRWGTGRQLHKLC